MKTTGKISFKLYQCKKCKQEKEIDTNHWGECYPFCNICNEQTVWECLESCPEGYQKPESWKQIKLRDIITVKEIK